MGGGGAGKRSVCVCVCVWEQLGVMVRSWTPNSHLGLAVVTLSESLYPQCSSVPSCKIGTWLWKGVAKRAKTSVSLIVPISWWGPGWTSGANTNTSGTVSAFLRVPSPVPGIVPNALAHSASV